MVLLITCVPAEIVMLPVVFNTRVLNVCVLMHESVLEALPTKFTVPIPAAKLPLFIQLPYTSSPKLPVSERLPGAMAEKFVVGVTAGERVRFLQDAPLKLITG